MLGSTIPFGDTEKGGRLKALGNPGVYWQVAACVAVSTLAVAGAACSLLWRRCTRGSAPGGGVGGVGWRRRGSALPRAVGVSDDGVSVSGVTRCAAGALRKIRYKFPFTWSALCVHVFG